LAGLLTFANPHGRADGSARLPATVPARPGVVAISRGQAIGRDRLVQVVAPVTVP
jgi:hypothetical protein